jgi:hypothetical protein
MSGRPDAELVTYRGDLIQIISDKVPGSGSVDLCGLRATSVKSFNGCTSVTARQQSTDSAGKSAELGRRICPSVVTVGTWVIVVSLPGRSAGSAPSVLGLLNPIGRAAGRAGSAGS